MLLHPKKPLAWTARIGTNIHFLRYWRTGALALGVALGIGFGLPELPAQARLALIVFAWAVVGWVFTSINDTYIALGAAVALTLLGLDSSEALFASLGDPMIWLLLSAFFIAGAAKNVGLAERLAWAVAGRARTVSGLFYTLSGVILLTAFLIPSTSGRAALLLPVFVAFATALKNPRLTRALALLFPTAILLSAVASLLGAGAHLLTAEMVQRLGGEPLSFFRWLLLGTPLALVSTLASTWVILHLFLSAPERAQRFDLSAGLEAHPRPLSPQEKYVAGVMLSLIGLWCTEPLHQVNSTLIALLGALAVTLPRARVLSFKEGLKNVEWNLLLFMAATLKLGETLVDSGAAGILTQKLFTNLGSHIHSSPVVVVGAVVFISLLSHLFIVSRTARSSVLVPLVAVLAVSLGYNPSALAFVSTAAAGYCLTLMVSAKPVTLFGRLEFPTFAQADLLRLSTALLPLHAVIFMVFALVIWPAMGLSIHPKNPLPSTLGQTSTPAFGIRWSETLQPQTPTLPLEQMARSPSATSSPSQQSIGMTPTASTKTRPAQNVRPNGRTSTDPRLSNTSSPPPDLQPRASAGSRQSKAPARATNPALASQPQRRSLAPANAPDTAQPLYERKTRQNPTDHHGLRIDRDRDSD